MTSLIPRAESSLTGADLSGSSGATNRTYTLAYDNYYSMIEVSVQHVPMHETADYTVSSGVITFLGEIFDDYIISLRYFTSDDVSIVTTGYGYVTTSDVYRTAGLTSTEVSSIDVTNHILRAEVAICRITKNRYWKINKNAQTTTSATNTTITQTGAGWTVNDFANQYIWIYSGTGSTHLLQPIPYRLALA